MPKEKKSPVGKIFKKLKKSAESPKKKKITEKLNGIPVYFHTHPTVMPDGTLYYQVDKEMRPTFMI